MSRALFMPGSTIVTLASSISPDLRFPPWLLRILVCRFLSIFPGLCVAMSPGLHLRVGLGTKFPMVPFETPPQGGFSSEKGERK
jgi:hypothetical protein